MRYVGYMGAWFVFGVLCCMNCGFMCAFCLCVRALFIVVVRVWFIIVCCDVCWCVVVVFVSLVSCNC